MARKAVQLCPSPLPPLPEDLYSDFNEYFPIGGGVVVQQETQQLGTAAVSSPTTEETKQKTAWWVWLLLALVVAGVVVAIVFIVRAARTPSTGGGNGGTTATQVVPSATIDRFEYSSIDNTVHWRTSGRVKYVTLTPSSALVKQDGTALSFQERFPAAGQLVMRQPFTDITLTLTAFDVNSVPLSKQIRITKADSGTQTLTSPLSAPFDAPLTSTISSTVVPGKLSQTQTTDASSIDQPSVVVYTVNNQDPKVFPQIVLTDGSIAKIELSSLRGNESVRVTFTSADSSLQSTSIVLSASTLTASAGAIARSMVLVPVNRVQQNIPPVGTLTVNVIDPQLGTNVASLPVRYYIVS